MTSNAKTNTRQKLAIRTYRLASILRIVPVLALVATPLVSAGAPTSAAAAVEPEARLQLVIKEIYIHDDRDGFIAGDGEMRLFAGIWHCKEDVPAPCLPSYPESASEHMPSSISTVGWPMVRAGRLFNAGTHDTVTLNREVPELGDSMWGKDTSPELGFAVYSGLPTVLQFDMSEWDGAGAGLDEYMGRVVHVLNPVEWVQSLGVHTARSVRNDGKSGDYNITYELRRTPLPDLKPVNITVQDLPRDNEKRVCMAVQNIEVVEAGPFEVALRVNGRPIPATSRTTIPGIASGNHAWGCVYTFLPDPGEYELAAIVDQNGALTEFSETNNVFQQSYVATAPAVAAGANLVVSSIRVDGQVPDGQEDCKDGRNDVALTVQNQGSAPAGSFFVTLIVDDENVAEKALPGLDVGKSLDVVLDEVKIKKGPHTLLANADAKNAVAESDEGNNEKSVSVTCGK